MFFKDERSTSHLWRFLWEEDGQRTPDGPHSAANAEKTSAPPKAPRQERTDGGPVVLNGGVGQHAADERITSVPLAPCIPPASPAAAPQPTEGDGTAGPPAGDARWYVIHAGRELGALSLAELVGKAAMGEIGADDLVRQPGGQWTKASEVGVLRQHFPRGKAGDEASQEFFNKLGRIYGNWPSLGKQEKAVAFGCCVLLILVVLTFVWAISKSTNSAQEAYNRGRAWLDKKEYGNAIKEYNQAIRLDPNNASYYTDRGTAWLNKKEYDNAIADFNEAIRRDPNDVPAFWNRGCAWLNKKEYDKAIKDFSDGIRLDPNNAILYRNRGIGWGEKGDYNKAIGDFDEAIRLNPKDASAFYGRGQAWSFGKVYDKAIKDYDEAIRLDPNNASFHASRALAWDLKKIDDKEREKSAEYVRGLDAQR
jgi:tetratricopeptide (TPR) repeat protein